MKEPFKICENPAKYTVLHVTIVPKVEYLGHMLSKNGIAPNPKRVKAIVEMPPPKNVSQLRSFIGMILYSARN